MKAIGYIVIVIAIIILILSFTPWGQEQIWFMTKGMQIRSNKRLIRESVQRLKDGIMNLDYVMTISLQPYDNSQDICREGSEFYIQVGVEDEKYIADLEKIITCNGNGRWQGFQVKIVVQSIQDLIQKYGNDKKVAA